MKKTFLFLLLLVFSSLFSFAEIIKDEFDDDGSRYLSCDLGVLNYPNLNGISFSCYVFPDGSRSFHLYLAINKKNIQISEGKKLLIKLDDGSIMEFANPIAKTPTRTFVAYIIPESEMEQLVSKKITKIRVEHDSGYLDQETTDNNLSYLLQQRYDEIQNALTPIDIYSDF